MCLIYVSGGQCITIPWKSKGIEHFSPKGIKNHAPWWAQSHKLKNRCLFSLLAEYIIINYAIFCLKLTTIAFDKVMYSRDIQYIYLKKSCIHAIYHKSRHYLTLMTDKLKRFISCIPLVNKQSTQQEIPFISPWHKYFRFPLQLNPHNSTWVYSLSDCFFVTLLPSICSPLLIFNRALF